jgi:copper(I)-binding protein
MFRVVRAARAARSAVTASPLLTVELDAPGCGVRDRNLFTVQLKPFPIKTSGVGVMTKKHACFLLAVTVLASCPLTGPALRHAAAQTAMPASFKAGDLTVEAPWIRATPRSAKEAAAYLKITNAGKEPDRLVGGTIEGAKGFGLHEMSMAGDVMKMRALPDGIEIKPGETVELKPGGFHVMATGLRGGFSKGETVKGSLKFAKGGTVEIQYQVSAVGASSPMSMPMSH